MRVIGKVLYGSNNYHLNGPASDKDYKVFVAPEFIDLYKMKNVSKSSLPFGYDKEHNSVMDIRQFDSLLRRGNVNTIEYLFSSDFNLFDNKYAPYFKLAREVYSKGYVAHVWKDYFASAQGLILNSIKRYSGTEEVMRKTTSRAIFMVNFIYYLINHYYCIDKNIWNEPSLYKFAREVRFSNEHFEFFNEENWLETFNYLKELSYRGIESFLKERDFLFTQYENEMQLCMQDLIAASIKKELEEKYI